MTTSVHGAFWTGYPSRHSSNETTPRTARKFVSAAGGSSQFRSWNEVLLKSWSKSRTFPRLLVIRGVPGKEKGILKTQDARSIKSQSEGPLLRRFLIPLRLFLLLLFLFRLHRRMLRVLRRRGPRLRRRRSVLRLRTLVLRRGLGPRGWLRPVGLGTVIWLGRRRTVRTRPVVRLCGGRTIRFGPTRFRAVWLWSVVRLGRRWTIGLRPIVRLSCRGTIGLRAVRFRPIIRRRLLGASGAVLRMRGRGIGRWLNCGTVVRRPCLFGWHDCAVVKRSRFRSSSD
jgi:hypothetical protein